MFQAKIKNTKTYKGADEQFTKVREPFITFERIKLAGSGLLALTVLVGMASYMIRQSPSGEEEFTASTSAPEIVEYHATSSGGSLPGGADSAGQGGQGNGTSTKLAAEKLQFGDFFIPVAGLASSTLTPYDLPLNVKKNVDNYYDFTRKINVDRWIAELNERGFALIDNPFPKEAQDFYAMHEQLLAKDVPVMLTSDFAIYFYQNSIKEIFGEIQSTVFYRDLWNIASEFYKIANERYIARRTAVGVSSDPVLEGARLEAAYFAVVLQLLTPRQDQLKGRDLDGSTPFSQYELANYSFSVPAYLKDDVLMEVGNIEKGRGRVKSPVMLYERDYGEFSIPEDYLRSAKLYNFFLATKWLNSPFPLFEKSENCPGCLLDRDDWVRSMIGCTFIVEDFSRNQHLKNRWARIYKVVSFIRGLRQDLTYLHYDSSLLELFGENYDAEKLYETKESREANIDKLRDRISVIGFEELEGGYPRKDPSNRPVIGMRILQDEYVPDEYISRKLTTPEVGAFNGNYESISTEERLAVCVSRNVKIRCRSIGGDIIHLLDPKEPNTRQFKVNSAFDNYEKTSGVIRDSLSRFTEHSWHTNLYWSTLRTYQDIAKSSKAYGPAYMRTDGWTGREQRFLLGSWINTRLPSDALQYRWQKGTTLGGSNASDEYVYVEPSIHVIANLRANAKMVFDTLIAIDVVQKIDAAYGKLQELEKDFATLEDIVKRELDGARLTENDRSFIISFLTRLTVMKQGNKRLEIAFPWTKTQIVETIDGLSILVVVNEIDGKKIISAGPVFNYREGTLSLK